MSNIRLYVLAGAFIVPILIILVRLVTVQVLRHNFYAEKASAQQSRQFEIPAKRGELYVEENGELYPVALNNSLKYIYADPQLIKDSKQAAKDLAPILELDPVDLEKDLTFTGKNRYIELKQQVDKEVAKRVAELKIRGIVLRDRDYRAYPDGVLFGHLTGYVNNDGRGQYGLEEYLNTDLSGRNGLLKAVTDSQGVPLSTQDNVIEEPRNGTSYVLTVDRYIQGIAEQALQKAIVDNRAASGSIIVMDPYTGEIKAMVNSPNYDPNSYAQVSPEHYNSFLNSAISSQFEPGSGFKPLTMAIGIENNKVEANTEFNDTGEVVIGEYTIHNADNKKFGSVNMALVIKNSINTGMVYLLKLMGGNPQAITKAGKEMLHTGIQKFGFGKKTGVELAGEASGRVKDTNAADIDYANMTFGQGIATTSLQMITAMSTIANGGIKVEPRILAKKILASGELEEMYHSLPSEHIVSRETADTVANMMIGVVEGGSGYLTRMSGYKIAGKTGTAQVPKANGQGYEEHKNIGSFIGFAPVGNPKFIMLVRIDYPQTNTYAERSAVPAFAEVARQLFSYYQVPPEGS